MHVPWLPVSTAGRALAVWAPRLQAPLGAGAHARAGVAQVISTSGDTHLGGEDFDHRVMDYFIKLIKKKYKADVSKDSRALQKLRREAERAKRALSSQHQARPRRARPRPAPRVFVSVHLWQRHALVLG